MKLTRSEQKELDAFVKALWELWRLKNKRNNYTFEEFLVAMREIYEDLVNKERSLLTNNKSDHAK